MQKHSSQVQNSYSLKKKPVINKNLSKKVMTHNTNFAISFKGFIVALLYCFMNTEVRSNLFLIANEDIKKYS